jgi:hypothetical protein
MSIGFEPDVTKQGSATNPKIANLNTTSWYSIDSLEQPLGCEGSSVACPPVKFERRSTVTMPRNRARVLMVRSSTGAFGITTQTRRVETGIMAAASELAFIGKSAQCLRILSGKTKSLERRRL